MNRVKKLISQNLFKDLRHEVFWLPFVLIISALIISIIYPDIFQSKIAGANSWLIETFGWLFSYTALVLFLLSIIVYLSPLGKIRLGGVDAKPIFSRWKWFAIVLCTTIATGILFWGTAEPIYHYIEPPESLDIDPSSRGAAVFSLSTLFLHWSFTPYAIYAIPSLVFALAFYSHKTPFSLKGMLLPLFPEKAVNRYGVIIEVLCLYALILGMAASLGAGILMIGGGLEAFVWDGGAILLPVVTLVIVLSFIISAATGLFKGIKYLSLFNLFIFIALLVFVISFAPWAYLQKLLPPAFQDFLLNYWEKSTFTGDEQNDPWPKDWSVFYWANWMAWAPVTALFLGRLGKGRTVREFMTFTWILPSLFALIWMSLFGGSILFYEKVDGDMSDILHAEGPNALIYELFSQFPMEQLSIPLFILAIFISYVTAADSNTEAISGMCTKNYFAGEKSPLLAAKLIWGVLIGTVSFVMISYSGIDGIRMLSNLGGLPSLFLLILVSINVVVMLVKSFVR